MSVTNNFVLNKSFYRYGFNPINKGFYKFYEPGTPIDCEITLLGTFKYSTNVKKGFLIDI